MLAATEATRMKARERDGLGKGKNVDTTDGGSEREKIPRLKRSAASQNQVEAFLL